MRHGWVFLRNGLSGYKFYLHIRRGVRVVIKVWSRGFACSRFRDWMSCVTVYAIRRVMSLLQLDDFDVGMKPD